MIPIKKIFKIGLLTLILQPNVKLFTAAIAPKLDQNLFDLGMRVRNTGTIYHLAISPNEKLLVSVSKIQDDNNPNISDFECDDFDFNLPSSRRLQLSVWNLETKTLISEITGLEDEIYSLAISPDNNTLAIGYYGEIRLINLKTMACTHILKTYKNSIRALAFSPDGNILAFDSMHKNIGLCDLIAMKSSNKVTIGDSIIGIAFNSSGNTLAICELLNDSNIKIMYAETGKFIMRDIPHYPNPTVSSDRKYLVFNNENRKIELFNLASMTTTCIFDIGNPEITALAATSDCAKIAVAIKHKGMGTIVVLPNNYVRERKNAILALASARIPRLGIISPAQSLTDLTLKLIYEMQETNVQLIK